MHTHLCLCKHACVCDCVQCPSGVPGSHAESGDRHSVSSPGQVPSTSGRHFPLPDGGEQVCMHNSPWHTLCSQFTLTHAVLTIHPGTCRPHIVHTAGLCVQGHTQHAPTPQSLHVRSGALCARTHTACTHTSVTTCTLRGSVCKDSDSMHPHLSRYMYAPGLCVQGLTQHAPTPQSLYM